MLELVITQIKQKMWVFQDAIESCSISSVILACAFWGGEKKSYSNFPYKSRYSFHIFSL